MGIGIRIKEARNNLGITQEELAKLLGITKGAVANYENETSHPKEPIMYKLIAVLNVDANYLFQDMVRIHPKAFALSAFEINYIKKYRSLDAHGKEMTDMVIQKELERIDKQNATIESDIENDSDNIIELVFTNSKASAGTGALLIDDGSEVLKVLYNEDTRKADICIEVAGDSMEPRYSNGDILLVRRQPDIDVNEIGIFMINDEGFVKKKGSDRLISLNRAYDDIRPNECDEVLCYGKVVGKLEEDWIVGR